MWQDDAKTCLVIDQGNQAEDPVKRTSFELLTQLILPSLSALAAMVALLKDQPRLAWLLFALVFLSMLLSFFGRFGAWVRRVRSRRQDRRVSRRASPEALKFLSKFGRFIGYPADAGDTLHTTLINGLCNPNGIGLDRLGVLPIAFLHDFCYSIQTRLNRPRPAPDILWDAIFDFSQVIKYYCCNCTDPIFARLPKDVAPLLTPSLRSNLESFRERFVYFLDRYEEYLNDLQKASGRKEVIGHHFPRPQPLA